MSHRPRTAQLYDEKQAVAFYEDRYDRGYLDEWPPEKKRKILEVIRDLGLPKHGSALDFGCGNGVLTQIVREALPSWSVCGTDISATAVSNATKRYPGCRFFVAGDPSFAGMRFDFVFTNHVVEHVFDLPEVFRQMTGHLKQKSSMLHFLPCGNAGSFEHGVCLLRDDGIDPKLGNRFFFEDEGHVRRLTTEEFRRLCATGGFELSKEFYSNQYYGAIDWITNSHPRFVLAFCDTSHAIDQSARRKLRRLRARLLPLAALRLPAQIVNKLRGKRGKRLKHYLALGGALILYPLSWPLDRYLKARSRKEWERHNRDRGGSEMCLYFERR
jgi:SAM-dependent methyltransferase